MAEAGRHVLDLRLRPRGGAMGRRDAVEVPRRRLDRAVGRPARRRDRDAVVREPPLRAGRPGAAPGRALRRGGRRAPDGGRRRPRVPSARGGGRRGARSDVHRRRLPCLGGRARGRRATPRRGTSSSPAATVDALAETFEDGAGKPLAAAVARRLDAAEAAGGDSRGRQSAALLVVERDARLRRPLGHARRPPRRRPRRPARRAAPALRPARGALRADAARSVDTGRRCAPGGARRAPRTHGPREPRFLGGSREPRGARRRRGRRSTRSCSSACRSSA